MYTYRGYRIAPLPSQSQPPPAPPAQQEFFLPLKEKEDRSLKGPKYEDAKITFANVVSYRHGDDIDLRSEFRPDESNNTDPALPCTEMTST
ncbi:hypothetical protein COOONC_04472 [Cooperia oncophora]